MKSRQSGLPSHAFYPVALKMSCSTVLLSYLHQHFRHCAVSGLPSRAFYSGRSENLFLDRLALSRFLLHHQNARRHGCGTFLIAPLLQMA
jgi:hypothetical protein